MKKLLITVAMLMTFAANILNAQNEKADTVIVPLANSSKVIFIMKDRSDLNMLRQYDFQKLFKDVLDKMESLDSTHQHAAVAAGNHQEENNPSNQANQDDNDNDENDDGDDHDGGDNDHHHNHKYRRFGRTWQSTNVDLGINNYLNGDTQFPDGDANYAVRPWGSWYVGINSVQRTRMARKFFLEWGLGVSWYNFKFQKDNIVMSKDASSVSFNQDARTVDFIKSKLTATYLNASLVPVIDFGDRSKKDRMWDGHRSEFRFGIGPYVGYRIGTKHKLVFEEDNDRHRQLDRDNFYLNNLRYGVRVQFGIRSTDFFFNYDLNELFTTNKGPELHAMSFGVIF